MDTEVIATSAVKTSISITDYLSPFINERDKEPIWDGNIYVFSSKSKKNEFLEGRVPVQVKSKGSNDLSKDTIKYSINTNDLDKFLADNGVIYFVVFVSSDGGTKIYYNDLLPIKIKQLLKGADKQKTISVALEPFPTDKSEKVDLFLNFLHNREKQKSVSSLGVMSMDDLAKAGQLKELSFGYRSIKPQYAFPFNYLFDHSVYIYANTSIGIKVPVMLMDKIMSAETTLKHSISVNGKKYYDNYEVIYKKDSIEFLFGKSLIFEFKKGASTCTMSLNLQGTLKQRITDETFLIDIMGKGTFYVDEVVFPVNLDVPEEIENFHIEDRKIDIENLRTMQAALDEAGVKCDLQYSSLTSIDEANFKILIDAFVYHKSVSFGDTKIHEPIGKMTIANICMMLIAAEQDVGLYRLTNFFSDHIPLYVEDDEGNYSDTSQFMIMNKENFLQVSNIDYDAILNDVITVKGNSLYYRQATQLLLNMLLAYDESTVKKKELIDAAGKISEWLLSVYTDKSEYAIRLLNYLQTIKRSRPLMKSEIEQLHTIIEGGNVTDDVLTGSYILLENPSSAKLHYDKLSPEYQKKFDTFPICNIWDRNR